MVLMFFPQNFSPFRFLVEVQELPNQEFLPPIWRQELKILFAFCVNMGMGIGLEKLFVYYCRNAVSEA